MEWSETIKKRLQEKAQECKILSESHETEAFICNRNNLYITMLIRIIGVIFTILQIVAIATKNTSLIITIPIATLTSIHLILTEISNHYQYKTREKENIKAAIDYRVLHTNIILTLSEDYNLEIPKSSYAQYVFNTFNRIKTNSPYLRIKNNIVPLVSDHVITLTTNPDGQNNPPINNRDKRSVDIKIDEEIKHRLENNGINSINEWEAHRLIYNV